MAARVNIETTIPSYLKARQSTELAIAGQQQVTRDWWSGRGAFELFASRLVIEECRGGDPQAAADRLAALAGIPLLEEDEPTAALATALVEQVPLPPRATADALHIAVAAGNGMDYFLTWNCKHIANVTLRTRIEAVCRAAGCEPPLICTPLELRDSSRHDE